jgi:hypothetical protein
VSIGQNARLEEIIEFLNRRQDLVPQLVDPSWLRKQALPTVEEYAGLLLDDAEFRSLQVGNWLGTTNGQIISEGVAQVIPPFYRPEYELVVEGMKLAANQQAISGQATAGKIALGVFMTGLVVSVVAASLREAA